MKTVGPLLLASLILTAGCGAPSVGPDASTTSDDAPRLDGKPLSCGDGIVTSPEQCDGTALGGATCSSRGFNFGTLACTAQCTFDDSGCANLAWVTVPPANVATPITFAMGSPSTELCRFSVSEDQHAVTLTHRFQMAANDVTQAEFQTVMGYNPSHHTGCADCPVENLTWHEAASYANALSAANGLSACYACTGTGPDVTCSVAAAYAGAQIYACPGYRLPTGAEYELAARAGTTTAFYSGPITSCTNDPNADAIAWYGHTSGGATHAVGTKLANPWGLHDMAGNVFAWCHDWWTQSVSAETDPAGPVTGMYRVLRGGAYGTDADYLRMARRYGFEPQLRQLNFGVRPVRSL